MPDLEGPLQGMSRQSILCKEANESLAMETVQVICPLETGLGHYSDEFTVWYGLGLPIYCGQHHNINKTTTESLHIGCQLLA